MKLIFQYSNKEEILIKESDSKQELIDAINNFLYEKGYKTYYTRVWEENGRLKIDFGSWSEFFFIDGMTYQDWIKKEKK